MGLRPLESMTEKIIYEPHPVSPERKQELRAQGYRIIDARFKPAAELPTGGSVPYDMPSVGALSGESVIPAEPKRGRKPKET